MSKIILVDQDGVIADFEKKFLERWREVNPNLPFIPIDKRDTFYIHDDYPKKLLGKIEEIYNAPGFILSLEPFDGAIQSLNEMKELGYIVKICTSTLPGNKTCVEEKYQWIKKYLGEDFIKDLIITADKSFITGDYLIDDKPVIRVANIPIWEQIIFDAPYNKDVADKKRITYWSDWQKVIEDS